MVGCDPCHGGGAGEILNSPEFDGNGYFLPRAWGEHPVCKPGTQFRVSSFRERGGSTRSVNPELNSGFLPSARAWEHLTLTWVNSRDAVAVTHRPTIPREAIAPSDHLRVVLQLPSCSHFLTTLNDHPPRWASLGIRLESAWNPLGIRPESVGNPPGIRWESARNPLGIRLESVGNPPGIRFI